jgi:DNA-binding IclR family transcriptional regulator
MHTSRHTVFFKLIAIQHFYQVNAASANYVHIMNVKALASPRLVSGAQSIRRAIALVRRLTEAGREGESVAALSASTGIDRTTTHRMLKCMAEERLLENAQDGRYVLGPLAFEIGLAASERIDLGTKCRPALMRIAVETGDTVFLMARAGYDSVCADRVEGSYPVKTLVVDVGVRRPLGIGAGSLAILSALPADEAEAAIRHNAQRIKDFPGMTADRLRQLSARARIENSASMPVIGIPSAHAVSVALCTRAGRPIAALSVAAIRSRMTPEKQRHILTILKRESCALTAALSDSEF